MKAYDELVIKAAGFESAANTWKKAAQDKDKRILEQARFHTKNQVRLENETVLWRTVAIGTSLLATVAMGLLLYGNASQ